MRSRAPTERSVLSFSRPAPPTVSTGPSFWRTGFRRTTDSSPPPSSPSRMSARLRSAGQRARMSCGGADVCAGVRPSIECAHHRSPCSSLRHRVSCPCLPPLSRTSSLSKNPACRTAQFAIGPTRAPSPSSSPSYESSPLRARAPPWSSGLRDVRDECARARSGAG